MRPRRSPGGKTKRVGMIATDHAPHHYESKERDFDDAPFGITGLETALGLSMVELVAPAAATLPVLVRRLSTDPAKIFGLPGGSLARGTLGDVVVFDPDARWTVTADAFVSRSQNSPFIGRDLVGRVERTLVGGRTVYQRHVPS